MEPSVHALATTEVACIRPDQSLDAAICLMEERAIHHLPVIADGQLVGMLADRDLLLAVGWKLSCDRRASESAGGVAGPCRVESIMSRPVIALHPDDSISRAARMLVERKIGAMPVVSGGRMIGILSEADLLRGLRDGRITSAAAQRLPRQLVRDYMHAHVITVRPHDALLDVFRIFRDRRLRHVPVVVEGLTQAETLVGIVSDRDLRRALGESAVRDEQAQQRGDYYLGPTTVMEVMTGPVRTIEPDATLGSVIDVFLAERIHALPVVADNRLVGIITETDLVRAIGAAAAE